MIAWEHAQSLEIGFVLDAVDRALARTQPEIWNSGLGRHFTSPQYIEGLLGSNVRISMDRKCRALDNIITGRIRRTVKYQDVQLNDYGTPRAARQGLGHYLEFNNRERPHQALDYLTPAEVYFDFDATSARPGPGLCQADKQEPFRSFEKPAIRTNRREPPRQRTAADILTQRKGR